MEGVTAWLQELGIELEDVYETWQNGYAIGGILYRYGWQDDFHQFRNNPNAGPENIAKLSPNLMQMRLKIDFSKTKEEQVMNTLLRLKKFLKETPAPKKAVRKVLKKNSRAKTVEHLPEPGVDVFPAKIQAIEDKLQKFRDERERQAAAAHEGAMRNSQAIADYYQTMRQDRMMSLRQNKEFLQQWESTGMQNWKTNMRRKRDFEARDLAFRTEKAMTYKTKVVNYIKRNEEDEARGIDDFERNLISLGIDHQPAAEESKTKKKRNLAAEAADAMARIRNNRTKNEVARKAKEIRLLNMQKEQEKTSRNTQQRGATSDIGKILQVIINIRTSHAFKTITKHIARESEYKSALERYEEKKAKRDAEIEEMERQRKEYFDQVEANKRIERRARRQRILELTVGEMRKKHRRSEKAVGPILEDILSIVELGEQTPEDFDKVLDMFRQTLINSARETILTTFRSGEGEALSNSQLDSISQSDRGIETPDSAGQHLDPEPTDPEPIVQKPKMPSTILTAENVEEPIIEAEDEEDAPENDKNL